MLTAVLWGAEGKAFAACMPEGGARCMPKGGVRWRSGARPKSPISSLSTLQAAGSGRQISGRGDRQRSRAKLSSSVSAVQLGRSGAGGEAEAGLTDPNLSDPNLQTSASLPTLHAAPTQRGPSEGLSTTESKASVHKASVRKASVSEASVRTSMQNVLSASGARSSLVISSQAWGEGSAPHATTAMQTLPLASRGLSRADLRTWESRDRMLSAKSYHNEWTVLHSLTSSCSPCSPAIPFLTTLTSLASSAHPTPSPSHPIAPTYVRQQQQLHPLTFRYTSLQVRHKQRSVADMAALLPAAAAIGENARRARGGDARIDRRKARQSVSE